MVLRTKDLILLIEAFDKELKELKLCLNCYKYLRIDSYEEPNDWLTFVCEPPHQLVYAKQDRWPYWPSKVMAIQNNGHKYIVQYFEPEKFTRSIVTKERMDGWLTRRSSRIRLFITQMWRLFIPNG
jgi:hypothetical protein